MFGDSFQQQTDGSSGTGGTAAGSWPRRILRICDVFKNRSSFARGPVQNHLPLSNGDRGYGSAIVPPAPPRYQLGEEQSILEKTTASC